MQEKNKRPQQNDQEEISQNTSLDKNETLSDPGAPVTDYGSRDTERLDTENNERAEGKSKQADEETLGIP